MKRCPKCGVEKPRSDFSRDRTRKDGRFPWCKQCAREQKAANAEAIRERERKYRAINADAIREQKRGYYIANLDAIREQRRGYRRDYDPGYRATHKKETSARTVVRRAIESGKLARQPCEVCGEQVVDAHHEDYTRPLDVRWLCRSHHKRLHAELERSRDAT